ncbi:MAG TPA: DUF2911 domain-containing protein [Bryobacteraceae bacterium]|nr:DUF2911 domain-containing protein [Bryobacteraceae bacterium]
MLLRYGLAFGLAIATLAPVACGQGRLLSPPKTTSVTIDGKKITVDYGAPSMRGRRIMGYLVPFGEVWCTGANDATSLVTEADLDIGGMKVPKGSYTLWTVPNKTEWMLVINKQTGQWHTEYDESRDLGRVKINTKALPTPVETLRIDLSPLGPKQGKLAVSWETTQAWTPFTVLR